MKIEKGKRVRLKVKLQVKGGQVIEESVVEYFQGSGVMLPGLEGELVGLEPGAKRSGVIPADRAFGNEQFQPRKRIPRKEFPAETKLSKGQQFVAKGPAGQDVILSIVDVQEDSVEARLMHPLADKDISYDVEILSVTDPRPPPLPALAVAEEAVD